MKLKVLLSIMLMTMGTTILAMSMADADVVVIDDFTISQGPVLGQPGGGVDQASPVFGVGDGNATRELEMQTLSGGTSSANTSIGSGELTFSEPFLPPGIYWTILQYSDFGGTGGGTVDLTGGGSEKLIEIVALNMTGADPIDVLLQLDDDQGNSTDTIFVLSQSSPDPTSFHMYFKDAPDVDFSNISQIGLVIFDTAADTGYRFGLIQTAVPEPGYPAFILLVVSAAAMNLRRLRT